MTGPKRHPLIEEMKVFLSAGVYDVLSAKLAERAGFKTVVLSGYAVAPPTWASRISACSPSPRSWTWPAGSAGQSSAT